MRYLLCAFSPGNFLIELLPGLFKLIIAQADLLLKMFKSFQRDFSCGAGLVDIGMFQSSRRKKTCQLSAYLYVLPFASRMRLL
jgi:hypothetical protein